MGLADSFTGGLGGGRYGQSDFVSQLGGPSAGFAGDASKVVQGTLNGNYTASDLHNTVRLAPFSNFFATALLFKRLEEGTAQRLGLPDNRDR